MAITWKIEEGIARLHHIFEYTPFILTVSIQMKCIPSTKRNETKRDGMRCTMPCEKEGKMPFDLAVQHHRHYKQKKEQINIKIRKRNAFISCSGFHALHQYNIYTNLLLLLLRSSCYSLLWALHFSLLFCCISYYLLIFFLVYFCWVRVFHLSLSPMVSFYVLCFRARNGLTVKWNGKHYRMV